MIVVPNRFSSIPGSRRARDYAFTTRAGKGGSTLSLASSTPKFSSDRTDGRWIVWLQSLALFALGFLVMHLFYAGTVAPGAEIGVPGHDSFYHIAMASILPKWGAMDQFPWLEYVYFRDHGDAFVSHHWGFHLLLLPFVKLAEATTGDALQGGRWAISAVFGANLVLFSLLLRQKKVPLFWLWIALFFLLPDQFFSRHGFVRAIGASFLFMQLTLLALFARRYWMAGLAVGAYVHLYLGAVMFGPILVATFAAMQLFGPSEDREFPLRLALITGGCWLVGVLTYPYAGGMFEFLKLQVFGSGLSPDIEVGREWKPYSDAWFLVSMAAPLFVAWTGALLLRLRIGPRLNAEETTLVVLQFAFLVLTFKARRFIEYWPPICLISAAYLAAEPLRALGVEFQQWWRTHLSTIPRVDGRAEGRLWGGLALGLATIALAATGVWAVLQIRNSNETAWLFGKTWVWAVPLILIGLTELVRVVRKNGVESSSPWPSTVRVGIVGLLALVLPATTLAIGADSYSSAIRQLRCYYDIEDLESMMAFFKADSEEGDVIFTDDWDVFPPFFFFNRHNHYIVGLDPKFTHQRQPDLWSRYVKISRGQVPSTIQLAAESADSERATVGLVDIREHFKARYVIADDDHRALSDALAAASDLAECVYPSTDYDEARKEEYVVFRIRSREEQEAYSEEDSPVAARGPLPLSGLRPTSVSQGWGDLGSDVTVDGNTIRLGGEVFSKGIGTHAPSRLLFDIPEGFAWFEATVGIDDETNGQGSVVASVLLDGVVAYESPTLVGGEAPAVTRVPLGAARQIQLETDPTEDGNRFDHVCWGGAVFLREEGVGDSADLAPSSGSENQ